MSEPLLALGARDVIRALGRSGFAIARTSDSHCRLIHTCDAVRKITIRFMVAPVLKRGTVRSIIAQAELTVADFWALL